MASLGIRGRLLPGYRNVYAFPPRLRCLICTHTCDDVADFPHRCADHKPSTGSNGTLSATAGLPVTSPQPIADRPPRSASHPAGRPA